MAVDAGLCVVEITPEIHPDGRLPSSWVYSQASTQDAPTDQYPTEWTTYAGGAVGQVSSIHSPPPHAWFQSYSGEVKPVEAQKPMEMLLSKDQLTAELAVMRREMNTLRVADSQNEVQFAEMTRHLREIQSGLRQELLVESSLRQEQAQDLVSRLEVALQAQESAARDSATLREELAKVAGVLEAERRDRIRCDDRNLSDNAEFRAFIEEGQRVQEYLNQKLEEQSKSLEASLKVSVVEAAGKVMDDAKALLSLQERGFSAAVVEEATKRKTELTRITEGLAALQVDRSQLRSTQEVGEAKLKGSVDLMAGEFRGQCSEVRKLIEKRSVDLDERCTCLAERLDNSLQLLQDQVTKLTEDTNQQIVSVVNQCNAKIEALDSKYIRLTSEQRQAIDAQKDKVEDQLARKHNFLSNRLEELEVKVKSSCNKLSGDLGSQLISIGELQASAAKLEETFQQQLYAQGQENQSRYLEIKELMAHEKSSRDGQTGKMEVSFDVAIGSLRKDLTDHKNDHKNSYDTLHGALCESREHATKERQSLELKFLERLDEADRRACDVGLNTAAAEEMLSNLERRLRDDIMSRSNEHRGGLQQLEDKLTRCVDEQNARHLDKHAELNELIARMSVQEKAARDGHRDHLNDALESFDQKLRRELGNMAPLQDMVKEQLGQETKSRERAHQLIHERIGEIDKSLRDVHFGELRKVREDLLAEVNGAGAKHFELKEFVTKASSHTSERLDDLKDFVGKMISQEKSAREELRSSMLSASEALAIKLRREIDEDKVIADRTLAGFREQFAKDRQERDAHHTSLADAVATLDRRCREEMQARCEEQRSGFFELKDTLAHALSSEVTARNEMRAGLDCAVESLEANLRRELADDSIIREHVARERQSREKGLITLCERFSEIEGRLSADLAHAAMKREALVSEMRELVIDSCSKERMRLQEILMQEVEARESSQENMLKQVAQERAAREVQQETLRVYLSQDRAAREAIAVTLQDRIEALERIRSQAAREAVPRTEIETMLRRVWEAVDSHSYALSQRPTEVEVPAVQQIPIQMVKMPAVQQQPTVVTRLTPQKVGAVCARDVSPMRGAVSMVCNGTEVTPIDEAIRASNGGAPTGSNAIVRPKVAEYVGPSSAAK
jgi:hypothetical protein